MKKTFLLLCISLVCSTSLLAQRWTVGSDERSIRWIPGNDLPHEDNIEMTGEQTSVILRWGVDENKAWHDNRALVFPLLRKIPNDTHGSLVFQVNTDIPSMLILDGYAMQAEEVKEVRIDGTVNVRSLWRPGHFKLGIAGRNQSEQLVEMKRSIYPSTTLPIVYERYELKNNSSWKRIELQIPEFSQAFKTEAEKGVTGSYIIQSDIIGAGRYSLGLNESIVFYVTYQGYREGETALKPDMEAEYRARREFADRTIAENLILETPDNVINTEFHFAKIRASESIIRTKGGLMHAPGGEVFYAALWANDQAEYVNPFFPYLGYKTGNEQGMDSYLQFARFMNDEYEPIPSSIISEGDDIWNGVGDRGDAAMIANGASRFALAGGNRENAEKLWPLIEWCLEFCRLKKTEDGVIASDSDELEGRFPVGKTNLATSTLYYDALNSAVYLGRALGKPASQTKAYEKQAKEMAASIEKFFGRELEGYCTYRYSEANDKFRAWMCMPLVMGINERAESTVQAMLSPKLYSEHGFLTEEGDGTYWDRSTLYALRGFYSAGFADTATPILHDYSVKRLTGGHVPYPIEAWPEGSGSMRHLSAESGLYCRIMIEGMFGIRPTGLDSFEMKPSLPSSWERAALRHIRAFGSDFDIEVIRNGEKYNVVVAPHEGKAKSYTVKHGAVIKVKL